MPKRKLQTTRWDAADYLDSPEAIAAYLEAALEDGDAALISAALGDVARSAGMAEIARKTGMGRESLYKALSTGGNPRLSTLLKVFDAIGLQLRVEPVHRPRSSEARSAAIRARSAARRA